jgi:hypothetical protein
VGRFGRSVGFVGAEELPGILAQESGIPVDRVTEILRGSETGTDEELIHLGRDLEELAARARGGTS